MGKEEFKKTFKTYFTSLIGYVILRAGVADMAAVGGGLEQAVLAVSGGSKAHARRQSHCARIHHIYQHPELLNESGSCFVVTGDKFDSIVPADIWELEVRICIIIYCAIIFYVFNYI